MGIEDEVRGVLKAVNRPPKVVTADNASITDRTKAWIMVEDAQHALNTAVLEAFAAVVFPPLEAMTAARTEFNRCPPLSVLAGERWRAFAKCQQELNRAVRKNRSGLFDLALHDLDAALDYYQAIGGAKDRLPGVGGLS